MATGLETIAVWVLTVNGLALAETLSTAWPRVTIHCTRRLSRVHAAVATTPFERLSDAVAADFSAVDGHIFIMAAGIVVRTIAPLLETKTKDPAIVVVDDAGRFAISLVAGHIGGANRLAAQAAEALDATPVITTATDSHGRPAIDTIAAMRGLTIENPAAIKGINMALLEGSPVPVYDPGGWLGNGLGEMAVGLGSLEPVFSDGPGPGVFVDDRCRNLPPAVLVLRPPSLVAGIGCNRGTPLEEIEALLRSVMAKGNLSLQSLAKIASVDVKDDEQGLLSLTLDLPLVFHSKDALNRVGHVPNPSPMVAKHIGVKSVCEAAALLTAGIGTSIVPELIAPKQKTPNVTVAIARRPCSWSASDQDI